MATIDVLKVGNTITISSAYAQGLGNVNRLGAAQIQFTTPTVGLVNDIFFKFYSCNDSTGTKVYTPIDITGVSAVAMERFLTMVFLNYYNDSTIVNFLSTQSNAFTPLAQRLADVLVPDTPLSTNVSMPPKTGGGSNFVEFVGMGMGSYFGAKYINDGATDFFNPGALWGTRVGQVHITTTDPLGPAPIEALYDNTDSGCWRFSEFNTNGVIVYTNLTDGAFTPAKGLGHWGQMLCVWPLISELLSASFACVFNNLDQSFMKSGLGYFNRTSRKDTYFGWSGNFIQSIFNDWSIPVISPVWSLSDLSIAAMLTNTTALNNGSISDQAKKYRFVGPVAANNISSVVEKSARSLLPLLWANECRYGSSPSETNAAYPFFDTTVQTLGFSDGASYISDCIASVSLGYNAHVYRSILQDVSNGNNTPTNTRLCVTNGVSWSSTLATQPTLSGVFVDGGLSRAKYYPNAISDFFTTGNAAAYATALANRIEFGFVGSSNFPMDSTDIANLQAWVYTP